MGSRGRPIRLGDLVLDCFKSLQRSLDQYAGDCFKKDPDRKLEADSSNYLQLKMIVEINLGVNGRRVV